MLKEQLQKETQEAIKRHPRVVEEYLTKKCLKAAKKGKTSKMFYSEDTLPDGSELTREDIFTFAQKHDLICDQSAFGRTKLSWR